MKKSSKGIKEHLVVLGACGAVGLGIGYAAESHTNEVSRGRLITIDTCMSKMPHEDTINEDLLDCMQGGVPGGNKIGNSLKQGQPIEYVESFRRSQQDEANTADTGTIAVYGLGGLAVGVLIITD